MAIVIVYDSKAVKYLTKVTRLKSVYSGIFQYFARIRKYLFSVTLIHANRISGNATIKVVQ